MPRDVSTNGNMFVHLGQRGPGFQPLL